MSESNLNDLLGDEGEVRDAFEKIMRDKYFKVERDEIGEYMQAAVFHMWTGYCLAKAA
jgi:hypothetical protein